MNENRAVQVNFKIPPNLLKQFDEALETRGYQDRSEAIRDLIRKFLEEQSKEALS